MLSLFNVLIAILLATCPGLAYRQSLRRYWLSRSSTIEEYKENGRSCGNCQLPFTHGGELHYGCRPFGNMEHACQNSNGVFINCPSSCPFGSATFSGIQAEGLDDGESVILHCYGYGSPNPTLTWLKNGQVLDVKAPTGEAYPAKANISISLRYAEEDYGRYSCMVNNTYSWQSSDSSLESYNFIGDRLPSPPTNVRVLSQIRSHVTLIWDPESGARTFQIRMKPGLPHRVEKLDIPVNNDWQKQINHLEPGIEYSFQVRGVATNGYLGHFSDPLHYTLPADAILDRPVNLTVVNERATRVSLKWDFDGDQEARTYYQIYYAPVHGNENETATSAFLGRRATVKNLLPDTEYKFEVEAHVSYIFPRRTDPVYAKTLPIAPRIKSMNIDDEDHNVLKITCTAFGGPPPDIIWKYNSEIDEPATKINTTLSGADVTSVLTVPRSAFVYTTYTCEASNGAGNATDHVTVDYDGNHPPVALERMVRKMMEDLETIKNKVE